MRQWMVLIVAICLLLSGCAPVMEADASASPADKSLETPEPSPKADRFSYSVMNAQIIRADGDEKQSIYDAEPYYDANWTTWVGSLTVLDDALYFTEGSVFSDGVSCICETENLGAAYAVVRTDKNGEHRQVLAASDVPSGFWEIEVLGGFVFYVQSVRDDALTIGYVGKDGSPGGVLNLSPFAAKDAVLSNAVMGLRDGRLLIDAEFFDGEGMQSIQLVVDEGLAITVMEE